MKYTKIFLALSVVALLSACSLDREPKDPSTVTKFDQDAVFTKIYATFATTGQKGPDGNGDVDGIDEGTSAFYRIMWELNEFPTDEGWWQWNDVGLAEIRTQEWTKSNDLVTGLYYRFYFNITLCNHFLDKTAGATDEYTLNQIAEVRMIRAINYYYVLDMFNGGPLCITVDPDNPKPVSRKELFTWLEYELKDLCGDRNDIQAEFETQMKERFGNAYMVRPYGSVLPEKRASLYRVDRTVAWFMLMRLYLNKGVYYTDSPDRRSVPDFHSAAWYASRVIVDGAANGLKLYTGDAADVNDETGEYTFSAYQKLFMGDNDRNGAQQEAVFMIYQDAVNCQSWGNARFLVNATRDGGMVPSGSSDSWSCFRTSPEFVYYFFDMNDAPTIVLDEYHMPMRAHDDRCILCSGLSYDDSKVWTLSGGKAQSFFASWAMCKWTGIYSDAKPAIKKDIHGNDSLVAAPWNWTSPVGVPDWVDTDIPLFRVAEAYLTYAEAVAQGGNTANGLDALACLNAVRERAHATPATQEDLKNTNFMLAEWAREFYGEGRRRTDLIRYGQFAGENVTMNWEGHEKKQYTQAKYNVYPIPESDETANKNLAGLNAAIGY